MKLSKRLLAFVLTLAMVLAMAPVIVLAGDSEGNYLTFTAEETSSISLAWKSADSVSFRISTDGGVTYSNWQDIDCKNVASINIPLSAGCIIQFKGTNVITSDQKHFSMTGKIAASGDVTSLTNGSGGKVDLAWGCYKAMFMNCTGLITAPNLPSTSLAIDCYSQMFEGCISLTTIPNLPATDLMMTCYESMFKGCSSLKVSTSSASGGTAWIIPEEATTATNWNNDMFSGTGGTFTGNPVAGTTYYIGGKTQLTVTDSTADGKTYDGTTDANVTLGTVSGIANGDDVQVVATGTFDNPDAGNGKTITIKYSLTGDDASKYIAPADSTTVADISRKLLSVSGTTVADKAYDGNTDATVTVGTVSGIVDNEDVTVTAVGTFDNANVGTDKVVSVVYSISGANAKNYAKPNDENISAKIKYLKASFETNGAGTIDDQNLAMNDKITKPTDPTKAGYVFTGWYKDSEFTTEWDFKEDSVTEDITLYAKWVELGVETPKNGKVEANTEDLQKVLDKYKDGDADKTLVVKLDVSEDVPDADKALLEKKAGDSKIQAFDTSLLLIVDGVASDIGGENDTLISVTYKFDFEGKENVKVLRVHNGVVDELGATPNANGEFTKTDEKNGTVTVVAMTYSTYAIVYDEVVEEKKEEVANTADTTIVAVYAAMSSLSTAAFVLLKKKEN